MSLDHPLHPATVHFPLAFLFTSYAIDAVQPILPHLPSTIASFLPATTELTRISYYALSAGLLTSIPAVFSGGAQAWKMIQAQGIYESDNKTIKPKVQATIAHAASNDLLLIASAYSWYCRRQGTLINTYAPENWMIGMSVILLGGLLFSANLGGTLTYNYGMGMSMGKGKGKSQ